MTATDEPFHVRDAAAKRLTKKQLRSTRLQAPFVGVRSTRPVETALDRARAYAVKMHRSAFFSHVTAAVLHGIWLPATHERGEWLDVAVPPGVRAPRAITCVGTI